MAESDTAGPAPRRKRRYTVTDAIREIDRSAAPMRAMLEQAERQVAPLRASAERAAAIQREILGEEDEGPPPAPKAKPSTPTPPSTNPSPRPERSKPPKSTDAEVAAGWALYERLDAPEWFVGRLREWWGPFDPSVVLHWVRLEREIKSLRHEIGADERSPEAFERDRLLWSPEDLVAHLEETRMIPKRDKRAKPGRPRKRVAAIDVHQWIAAQLLEDPTFRHLSRKEAEARSKRDGSVGWSASAIGNSSVWKAMKADLKAEEAAKAERARAEFEGRLGEDEDHHGMRVGRKSGLGRQRIAQEDRDHHRAAEDFIREAEANRKVAKKRTK